MFAATAPVEIADWIRFREWAETKCDIRDHLESACDARAFAQACVTIARAHGLSLSEPDVIAAIAHARHTWLQRRLPSSVTTAGTSNRGEHWPIPADWMPIHLSLGAQSPSLDLANFGRLRLSDPFFEQSAGAALRSPAALLFRCRYDMDTLEVRLGAESPELRPAGFVFHLSRCGSTLVAQILASSPRHRVLSEAPPIDQLLAHDAAAGLPRPRRVARLRALVNTYARRRFPEERHLLIKWDAWHTLHLDIIQEAFPDTPWIYLHREPVEILVSQRRQRGYQFLPGMMNPALFGIDPTELPSLNFDTYAARVLGASAAAAVSALSQPGHRGIPVDYANLRDAASDLLREHFNLADCTDSEQTAMQEAAALNSKNPMVAFSVDTEAKQREADQGLRFLTEQWLGASRRALLDYQRRVHRSR